MADERIMGIDDLMGQFRGKGVWRDSAGNTKDYEVSLNLRAADDAFEISQKHVLRDGTGSELEIGLEPVAPCIYRVDVPGQDGGFGFAMNDVIRFWFNNHLGSITEVGFQAKAPGALVTYGFTNRNSAGNYIMWHEDLERVNDSE